MSHPQHPQACVCMLCAHYDSQRQQAAQGLATNQQLAAQGCLSQQQFAQGQGLSQGLLQELAQNVQGLAQQCLAPAAWRTGQAPTLRSLSAKALVHTRSAEAAVLFEDDIGARQVVIPGEMLMGFVAGLYEQGDLDQQREHLHFLRWAGDEDALVCDCGVRVTGECLSAAGFVSRERLRKDSRESRLADRCGELARERDEARARVGELELELRRLGPR